MVQLTPELMLHAYANGIFPMAETSDSPELYWMDPDPRAILPLESFHCSRTLRQHVIRPAFDVRINTDFAAVIDGCATTRDNTWINGPIRTLFTQLHIQGAAHTVEAWEGDRLVGGLYGVALGAAFFGESMFSRVTNASKVCLVHLVARLRANGFRLLDVQYRTDHLLQFGVEEISRDAYHQRLKEALRAPLPADAFTLGDEASVLLAGMGLVVRQPPPHAPPL